MDDINALRATILATLNQNFNEEWLDTTLRCMEGAVRIGPSTVKQTLRSQVNYAFADIVKLLKPVNVEDKLHPSHVTRSSDASTFDEICTKCGVTDRPAHGLEWGDLALPCSAVLTKETTSPE